MLHASRSLHSRHRDVHCIIPASPRSPIVSRAFLISVSGRVLISHSPSECDMQHTRALVEQLAALMSESERHVT